MAEGTRLLSEYGAYYSIAGSNPALSAIDVVRAPAPDKGVGVWPPWRRGAVRQGATTKLPGEETVPASLVNEAAPVVAPCGTTAFSTVGET